MEEEVGREVEGTRDVREYVAALRRRKGQIIAVAAVLAGFSIIVAFALPPVYRAYATILVQEQEVPPDLVRSTITSFADERIQVISRQVMTRAVLLQLIDTYGLYEKYRGRVTTDELLDRFRRDIKLTTVNADMSDRSSGRRVNATIAFTISYDAPQPLPAKQVVDELVTLYLNENIKVRQQSASETASFLAQESDRLAKQIQTIETRLAEFKRRNVGRMPDSSTINIQLAERTESELQRVERDISMLQDRKVSLEAQLAVVRPSAATIAGSESPTSPEERLRQLQARYTSLSGRYGPDHPDVKRVQREIAVLKPEVDASARADPGAKPPTATRSSDKRPTADALQSADNPAYIVLSTQLESATHELARLTSVRDDLRARQRTYDARLLQIPEVEREYSELTRDYTNAQNRYREIKAKQLQAEGALELEKDSKAERFSLGEPSVLPEKPFSPNRPVIVLLGFIASLGSGLGLAFAREAIDPSVRGPLELARITPVPLLTAIPYIETEREVLGKRRKAFAIAGLSVAGVIVVVLALQFLGKPLPELFDSVIRRIPI